MKNDEYISIKEFANRAGVSAQSVYQRLNTSLKKYSRVENGKKTINTKALEEVYSIKVEQDFKQDFKGNFKGFNEEIIELLRQELKAKDNQIAELQKLLNQEQMLHARTQEKLLLLEQKEDELAAGVEEEIKSDNKISWWKKLFN